MNTKTLNYNRLNLLGKSCEPRITQENIANALGRTSSGYRKAIKAGTIYAHELTALAELFGMEINALVEFLESEENEFHETAPAYVKRKQLSDCADPLEWLRLAMSKSGELDKLINNLKR